MHNALLKQYQVYFNLLLILKVVYHAHVFSKISNGNSESFFFKLRSIFGVKNLEFRKRES